jgi:hypothetical protein
MPLGHRARRVGTAASPGAGHLVRRVVTVALGSAVLASLAVSEARADTLCSVTGFSPRSVTVGLSPELVTFVPAVTGCTVGGWSIEGGDYAFYVHDAAPEQSFFPVTNGDTAPVDVLVSAYNADFDEGSQLFRGSFVVKRRTGWDQFNASPEPVRQGAPITVKGRLQRADWEQAAYVGYAGRSVALEFRTATGSYRKIKTVSTAADGSVSTTVTASSDGYWRLRYGGNSTAGASKVAGDFVDVR